MRKTIWFIAAALFEVLPVWAAAPVEERSTGIEPLGNQQQRISYAKTQVERAEQEVRDARTKVEELTIVIQTTEKKLIAARSELEVANQREATAKSRLVDARKHADKESGILKAMPPPR